MSKVLWRDPEERGSRRNALEMCIGIMLKKYDTVRYGCPSCSGALIMLGREGIVLFIGQSWVPFAHDCLFVYKFLRYLV